MAAVVSPERVAEKIAEGGEPDEFWSAIGGKGEYSKEVNLDRPILEPRLFHCREMPSGKMRAVEINTFEQVSVRKSLVLEIGFVFLAC